VLVFIGYYVLFYHPKQIVLRFSFIRMFWQYVSEGNILYHSNEMCILI